MMSSLSIRTSMCGFSVGLFANQSRVAINARSSASYSATLFVVVPIRLAITSSTFPFSSWITTPQDALDAIEEGQAAARQCGVNLIAQVSEALDGDLDRLVRCVKLGGFVNTTPEFRDHPKVINGASELMIQVFGDSGRHARFAVGANSLPFGASVEIDGIFQVR